MSAPSTASAPPQSESTAEARRRGSWVSAAGGAAIVAATVAAYLPALRSGYIWDDDSYLTANPLVQRWDGLPTIWLDLTACPQYYPLVFTSFWIEHKLWGLDPFGYHLVNVLLHAVNALLVWGILKSLRVPAAWLAAALFALHPIQVESVAWITERKNVLSGLFYLLAFRSLLQAAQTGRTRHWLTGAAAYGAALLSKTVSATLPVALLLALGHRQGRSAWRHVPRLLPLLGLGAAMGLLTAYLERVRVGAVGPEWSHSLPERALFVAPRALLHYARTVAWPHPLMFFYPRWEVAPDRWTSWAAPVVTMALFIAAWLAARRGRSEPLWLLGYAAVTLFPALGLLNVYPHRYSWVADHFAYLGCLGFLLLYVLGLRALVLRWFPRAADPGSAPAPEVAALRPAALVVSTLALVAAGVLTFLQARVYRDAETLWRDTLAKNPRAWMAMVNLGRICLETGRRQEAQQLFEQAARYPIAHPEAYGNWGSLLFLEGRYAEAVEKYQQSLSARPGDPRAHENLAAAQYACRDYRAAARTLREAHARFPRRVGLTIRLAWLLSTCPQADVRDGRLALELARAATAARPADPDAWDALAAAAAETGDFRAAIDAASRAVALAAQRGQTGLAQRIEQRLSGYRASVPFRDAPR